MKKCTSENAMIGRYDPITVLVILVLGMRIMRSHKSCGPNVATLKALLMFSFVRKYIEVERDDESIEEIVDGSKAFNCCEKSGVSFVLKAA